MLLVACCCAASHRVAATSLAASPSHPCCWLYMDSLCAASFARLHAVCSSDDGDRRCLILLYRPCAKQEGQPAARSQHQALALALVASTQRRPFSPSPIIWWPVSYTVSLRQCTAGRPRWIPHITHRLLQQHRERAPAVLSRRSIAAPKAPLFPIDDFPRSRHAAVHLALHRAANGALASPPPTGHGPSPHVPTTGSSP